MPKSRVDETLELVGIAEAADRRTGGYSLGMRQRLALAAALLGDPQVLVLDEPINGLDPQGIRWIRLFLRHLASEGRTVLLSSHLLSEVAQTVDDLVVIRRGELAYAGDLSGIETLGTSVATTRVDADDRAALSLVLESAGAEVSAGVDGEPLRVRGIDARTIGMLAFEAGLPLLHLSTDHGGLEQSFLELVGDPTETSMESETRVKEVRHEQDRA